MITVLVLLFIYFIPFIICSEKPQGAMVGVLNLFLGWTFIGWVIALMLAVAPDSRRTV